MNDEQVPRGKVYSVEMFEMNIIFWDWQLYGKQFCVNLAKVYN